jgi:hypothetical protein
MSNLQSVGGVTGKETIYVDVDDEITAIIDKVGAAKGKVVALVLPKRAPVLQSIVNMKLLKRTADTAGKNLVLVTSEAGLMPLAGAVGLHVASTPTSKPSIPSAPAGPGDGPEDVDEPLNIVDGTSDEGGDEFNAKAVAGKTVGELAAAGAAGKLAADDIDDSIDMTGDSDDADADPAFGVKGPKPKKDRKLKVPNFDSFRKKIALSVLAVALLIFGWVMAFMILPHATVTIHTDSATIPTNLNLTLSTDAKTLDTANNVVPATVQNQQKTSTQTVAATGQQNNGQKATGSVTMTAGPCSGDVPSSISAGTSLSGSGHTFTLDAGVSFVPTVHSGKCTFTGTSAGGSTISITALKGGTDYNLSSANFSVSGRSDVTTSGSTSGGTDNIIKIVSASDISNATSKIASADSSSVKQQLTSGLQSKGLLPVPTTFVAGTPAVTTSAKAGDTADNVTVTAVTTFTMLGVQKNDVQKLVENNVNGQLDKGKQVILDNGVANVQFTEQNPATPTGASVSMEAKSEVGPQIDVAALKKQLAGKKSGDVKGFIKQTPGVTDVDVKYSPFWVGTVPKNAGKVIIKIVKAS